MEGRKTVADPIVANALVAIAGVGIAGIAVGLVLAPPIADAVEPEPLRFFDDVIFFGLHRPEPTELVRYAIAAALPLITAAVVLWRGVRPLPKRLRGAATPLRAVLTTVAIGLLLLAWFSRAEPDIIPSNPDDYFTTWEGVFALALAGLAVWLASSATARERLAGWARGRRTNLICWVAAVALTAILLLPAVFLGDAFTTTPPFVASHLPYYFSDYAALGAGTTPLVDHANHYTHLLPFAIAPVLAAFDWSPGALTVVLSVVSLATLLCLFRALATVTGSDLTGLALYVPALGLALLPIVDDAGGFVYDANIYSVLPERLLGPFVVAWICARHLRGLAPRRPWVLFFAAGLAAWNNPEFGLPCLLGAAAAALLAGWQPAARLAVARRVVVDAAIGILGATAVVCAITLIWAGSLPDLEHLFYFSRLSGLQGFVLIPMPTLGFWIVVYLTFGAAVVLAAVRAAGDAADRTLTGMLAYAGVLGLGAGVLYAGRSDKFTLTAVMAIWGLALALLAWWAIGTGTARLRVGVLGFAALVGLALGLVSLVRAPAPWTEIDRLSGEGNGLSAFELDEETRFVAERTRADEPVLILRENSDLIAIDAGVRNVSPVSEPHHVVAEEQLDFVLEALDESGADRIFTGDGSLVLPIYNGILESLRERGWMVVARSPTGRLTEWARSPSESG